MKVLVLTSFVPCEGSETTYPSALHNAEVYLQPPPAGRNDWHVRILAPKGPEGSSLVFRSTGTEIAAAKRIAAQIIESFWPTPVVARRG